MARPLSRAALLVLLASAAAPVGVAAASDDGVVSGRVIRATHGVGAARVWAYQLVDQTLHRTVTGDGGEFLFESLPAGLYKVIAFKSGFAPAMVVLTRATARAQQYLELELAEAGTEDSTVSGDFWSIREQLPGDVLREIDRTESGRLALQQMLAPTGVAGLLTEVRAESGMSELADQSKGQLTGGELGISGHLGRLEMDLSGNYRQLGASGSAGTSVTPGGAQTASLSLRLGGPGASEVRVRSLSNRMTAMRGDDAVPVDLEHYQVSWVQPLSPTSSSGFLAQYTDESGLYARARNDPAAIPFASRTWRVEGSYTHSLSERTRLQAGMRYFEQLGDFEARDRGLGEAALDNRGLELFGLGGWRVQPSVLVEYGLYSTLRDGSVSLVPRGGVVLQLGEHWQAEAVASHRLAVDGTGRDPFDFRPMDFEAERSCDQAEFACYLLGLSHGTEGTDRMAIRASQREFDSTVRLYFGDDFFDHLESVFLVPGDRLPELQFEIQRRWAPKILSRLSSSVAIGGGGVYFAANQRPYQNDVRYLVTALDTQFQRTSTGVYIAFHRLEQDLQPMAGRSNPRVVAAGQIQLERLELALTQKLNVLFDLAADWAVRVNMELSRGASPFRLDLPDSAVRKSMTTGVAVRF